MAKVGRIYKCTCLIAQKVYIGKTTRPINKRWNSHKSVALKKVSNNHFHNAIRKYGHTNFKIEVVIDNVPIEELDALEVKYIEIENSFLDGYNSTKGGEGTSGYTLSPEHIEILKKVHKGNSYGKGWKPTTEQLAKLSAAHKGKKLSASAKEKLSIMRQGLKHHNSKLVSIYDYYTNKLIAKDVCTREWCRENGYCQSALGKTARGLQKHHKGVYGVYTISYEDIDTTK